MSAFWDHRYHDVQAAYGTAPNAFFAAELAKLNPGKILLPGEGQGRNALHAARMGWKVVAFDHSIIGRQQTLKQAEVEGLSVEYLLADAMTVEVDAASFDALGLIFLHMPQAMRHPAHTRLLSFLRPGGGLILQGFAKSQLGLTSGGPKDPAMLFSSAEIRDDFSSMSNLDLRKGPAVLDEGPFHQGWAQLISASGQK